MAKIKTKYTCQECGYQIPKWMGKCPDCGAWNSMVEEVAMEQTTQKKQVVAAIGSSKPEALNLIDATSSMRIDTGIRELNRVLGGGLVKGELVLLSGDPGIGKSTITMQLMASIAGENNILYVSGEESKGQIRQRAERLQVESARIHVVTENNIAVLDTIVRQFSLDLLIVDSVQTIYDPDLQSATGSVSQLRAVATYCMNWAKALGIPTILIGHVTKDGAVAGPRVLEHMVDAVLFFEGDRQSQYRILRGLKNRFGSTNEIGLFDMTEQGLVEVENPSAAFLAERQASISGSVVTTSLEGTRPILVEVQSLVTKCFYGQPRCMATGTKYDRVAMIMAVLEKRAGLHLNDQDVYLNVVGGLRIDEPACDLAIAMAIVSGYLDKSVPLDMVFIGEIGLTGEVRQVQQLERRLQEAVQMGFATAVIPKQKKKLNVKNIVLIEVSFMSEVINKVWEEK